MARIHYPLKPSKLAVCTEANSAVEPQDEWVRSGKPLAR